MQEEIKEKREKRRGKGEKKESHVSRHALTRSGPIAYKKLLESKDMWCGEVGSW